MSTTYEIKKPFSKNWELYAERGIWPDSEVENELDEMFSNGQIMAWRAFSSGSQEAALQSVVTVSEAAKILGLSYNSLTKAAREGRVRARQSGKVWLSTIADVKAAIEAGHLRPRKRLLKSI